MRIDLHTHTNASDGALEPAILLERAAAVGLSQLAITDHDTLDGYIQARDLLQQEPVPSLRLVPGIELSAQWSSAVVHIVGLNFDSGDSSLLRFIEQQSIIRGERNEAILKRLEKLNVGDIRQALATQGRDLHSIGRPHIAKALVDCGAVKDIKQAFKKFLGAGKPAAVRSTWPSMQAAVEVIHAAGGVAVIAHPMHYRYSGAKLHRLVTDFKDIGGQAIEVVSGNQDKARCAELAKLAERYDLLASQGSDFHSDAMPWQSLGGMSVMPSRCVPVWTQWSSEELSH